MKRLFSVLFLLFFTPMVALAQTMPIPPETKAKQAILFDAQTGVILFTKNADERMPTSSMSKILTMYLVFEALKNGKIKLEDTPATSTYAWQQQGSRMFLNVGDRPTVQDLIRGVVVQSGNDASVVLAEALAGTEADFAEMMNAKAKELGMANSHFKNATGLPDPDHYSTARDLAILGVALVRDFPEEYKYFSETEYTYNNIKQGNRNPLLYRNINVDGIKTGHTESAGFGLVASSLRDNRRLVLVVNGLGSMQERADEPAKLLDFGYREYGLYYAAKAGDKVADAKTWLGEQPTVPVIASKGVKVTLPRSMRDGLKATISYDQPIKAPIVKGQVIGKIVLTAPNTNPIEAPLVAGTDVKQVGYFERFIRKLKLLLGKA